MATLLRSSNDDIGREIFWASINICRDRYTIGILEYNQSEAAAAAVSRALRWAFSLDIDAPLRLRAAAWVFPCLRPKIRLWNQMSKDLMIYAWSRRPTCSTRREDLRHVPELQAPGPRRKTPIYRYRSQYGWNLYPMTSSLCHSKVRTVPDKECQWWVKYRSYAGWSQFRLTCTATYAIDRGLTVFNPHKEALLERVAMTSILVRLWGRSPSPSRVSVSMSSAAEDGEVKTAL